MDKNAEEIILFDRIKQSIEAKQPVLIKLGGGDVWAVITGYHEDKNLPYLMKFRHSPQLNKDWYNKLGSIVFITDKYDSRTQILISGIVCHRPSSVSFAAGMFIFAVIGIF